MNEISGVYVMRVASMLTGMHPQTLRKYERVGLVRPSRSNMLRLYSDEDVARLKMIKHLVDEVGLNLAGVELALSMYDSILDMKRELASADIGGELGQRLTELLDEMLETLGVEP
jgi:MerR family transcriptional regulator/heat shock protein HspR